MRSFFASPVPLAAKRKGEPTEGVASAASINAQNKKVRISSPTKSVRHALTAAFLAISGLAHAEFRVLIVGIDHYSDRGDFHDLNGTKDAAMFAAAIRKYWGAEKPIIRFVLDREAKRDRILAEYQWLVQGAKPGDTLIFFFSGHGTDVRSTAPSGVRSALVPIDFRTGADGKGLDESSLITGAFFKDSLALLTSAGVRNVTYVIDACDSGAIDRGSGGLVNKCIENGADPKPFGVEGSGGLLFNENADTGSFVVISAAKADGPAWEGPEGGNLTVAVTDSIKSFYQRGESNGRPMTYEDLADGVNAEIVNLPSNGMPQVPYVKGRLDRPLFSFGSVASEPYYRVAVKTPTHAQPIVRVGGGQLLGIKKGDRFDLYPAGALDFSHIPPIAHAVATSVDLYRSTVAVTDLKTSLHDLGAARARVDETANPVPVDLAALAGNPKYRSLTAALRDHHLLDKATSRGAVAKLVPPGSSTSAWTVVAADGTALPVPTAPGDEELAENVEVIARDIARSNSIESIQSSDPAIRVEIQAIPVTVSNQTVIAMGAIGSPLSQAGAFTFRIRATGPTGKPLNSIHQFVYAAILDRTPDFKLVPLWPRSAKSSEDTRLPADAKWRYLGRDDLLKDGKVLADLAAWSASPGQGAGKELFKLFGTDEAVDYLPIVQSPNVAVLNDQQALATQTTFAFSRGTAAPISRHPSQTPSRFSVATIALQPKAP